MTSFCYGDQEMSLHYQTNTYKLLTFSSCLEHWNACPNCLQWYNNMNEHTLVCLYDEEKKKTYGKETIRKIKTKRIVQREKKSTSSSQCLSPVRDPKPKFKGIIRIPQKFRVRRILITTNSGKKVLPLICGAIILLLIW